MIAIVDYGSGNVGAIANIFKQLKVPHCITSNPEQLEAADRYILPGVGAFDTTMHTLHQSGLVEVLHQAVIQQKKKILGICVGMQILADSSDEGTLPGLGWIPGHIRRIDISTLADFPKLPHMGWNAVRLLQDLPLFQQVDAAQGFYFLHSYYFAAENTAHITATVHYGSPLPCGVMHNNIFGLQFHPEKSHANGVAILRNFVDL